MRVGGCLRASSESPFALPTVRRGWERPTVASRWHRVAVRTLPRETLSKCRGEGGATSGSPTAQRLPPRVSWMLGAISLVLGVGASGYLEAGAFGAVVATGVLMLVLALAYEFVTEWRTVGRRTTPNQRAGGLAEFVLHVGPVPVRLPRSPAGRERPYVRSPQVPSRRRIRPATPARRSELSRRRAATVAGTEGRVSGAKQRLRAGEVELRRSAVRTGLPALRRRGPPGFRIRHESTVAALDELHQARHRVYNGLVRPLVATRPST